MPFSDGMISCVEALAAVATADERELPKSESCRMDGATNAAAANEIKGAGLERIGAASRSHEDGESHLPASAKVEGKEESGGV